MRFLSFAAALILPLLLSTDANSQASERPGVNALTIYYNDLESILADRRLGEIPFELDVIDVQENDTLLRIAASNIFDELDVYHLAAALFQNNPDAFKDGKPNALLEGSALLLPTVADLYRARDQFERMHIENDELEYFGDRNVMRQGIRFPFDSSPEFPNAIVVWDVSLWGKRRAFTEHVEKLSELVSNKTDGEFILKLHYGGLSAPKENLDGIAAGKFQMAQFCAGYHPEKNPSITVLELPFLGVKTLKQERYISQWLYRHPAVLKDFSRWNAIALMPSPLPQYNIAGIGTIPDDIEDLSGLTIRATGGIGRAVAAVKALPTPTVASEVQQALEEGLIEAVAFAPHAHMSFNTVKSVDWWTTNLNPGTVNCPVVAGVDAVTELPEDYRDALYDSINDSLDHYMSNYSGATMEAWGPTLDEYDIQRVSFNDWDLEIFRDSVAASAAKEWIIDNASKGLPAQNLYDTVMIALTGVNPEQINLSEKRAEEKAAAEALSIAKADAAVEQEQAPNILPFLPDTANISQPQVLPVAGYLGPPRDTSSEATLLSPDPLKNKVEWELQGVSVGEALDMLSAYIGYQITTEDAAAISSYALPLPKMHHNASGLTVADAFQILSGRGLMTMFDHPKRSIRHVATRNKALPDCPENGIAEPGEGVMLLADGTECQL